MEAQYWWLLIVIFFFLVEIFTPGFFAASLGIGGLIAAIGAFAGGSLEMQLFLFSVGSLVSIFVLRPIIKKHFYNAKETKSNADAIIGKTGMLIQGIESSSEMGRVAIDGDEWQCKTRASLPLERGTKVRVISRDSIILTVEPLTEN